MKTVFIVTYTTDSRPGTRMIEGAYSTKQKALRGSQLLIDYMGEHLTDYEINEYEVDGNLK